MDKRNGDMSWKCKRPQPEDYNTQEEYEEAVKAYEDAETEYIERYREERCSK